MTRIRKLQRKGEDGTWHSDAYAVETSNGQITLRYSLAWEYLMELLVDELAAREVAERQGVAIVGFPGILIRACKQGLMTPEEVRDALQECQRQGTHYSIQFIEEIYDRLRRF